MGSKGGGTTQVVNQVPAPSQAELDLMALNKELAQRQIANIDQLAPFQQKLLETASSEIDRQTAERNAVNNIISPEDQARMVRTDFDRAQKLGPVQDELMSLQLEQLRQGGRATPQQLADIKAATDAGIASGSEDIDMATKRGIGLVEDELANSRGLRLSDSPIRSEADLVTRAGVDQKASLIKSMRAGEAQARLNFPLAVQQLQGGLNLNTQNVSAAASQFQAELRQRAFQNRLALTGQTSSSGLGLGSIGAGTGALASMTQSRLANGSSSTSKGIGLDSLGSIGQLAQGAAAAYGAYSMYAAAAASDRRLKDDYGVVGETKDGIALHIYKYKGEPKDAPIRLGVMADEVKKIRPKAVYRHSSGYDVVDYAGIGLEA